MARSIASVLTDFTPKHVPDDRITVFAAATRERADPGDSDTAPEDVVELIDIELKIKETFELGRAEGQSEAAVLFEAERLRLEREFQEQLAGAEADFMQRIGTRMFEQLGEGLSVVSAQLSSSLATVLAPLVEKNLRDRAVTGFATEVDRLTKGLEAVLLDISGPAHLLDALRRQPDIDLMRFTFTQSDQSELSMRLDDVVVETRLGHLIDAVKDTTR
ncbi:hypothetical protein [Phyllobacterium myrsinacearum]|uniref:Flagellar assembly protein FliH/Type III secretion system HrpE domain-containing protein n=1 Tax=Phyllobacterium myrsinacearum TaxID=28101 RepID=A0A839ETQ6_9HYPH|nr:hypothetical protein [Phyllobacterium myrsinacearum]MBA8879807.1 hypothetical protein [Phyllobacterium myrsinacearum]